MVVSGQHLSLAALTLTEAAPMIHWIGGCMSPQASLDIVEKRKILLLPGIEPQLSSL
jgi:hypothetical protein